MKRYLLALLVPLAVAGTAPAEPGRENVGFVVGGSNHFAADLFARIRETDGNVVFSPYALNSSLAMTSAGARGPTLAALDKAVHLPDQQKLHPAYRAYNLSVDREADRASGFRVTVAADLRGGRAVTFREDFLAIARANYAPGTERRDASAPNAIRLVRGDAPDEPAVPALEAAGPDGARPIMLTSTTTFKGVWYARVTADPAKVAFTTAGGQQVQTPMLRLSGRFGYAESDAWQMVEVPYANRSVRLIVLLPKKAADLPAIEKGLNIATLPSTLNRVNPRDVDLTLPRCRVANELALKKPLGQLGLDVAFTSKADFSGLSGIKEQLFLYDVIHRCAVEFDETAQAPPMPAVAPAGLGDVAIAKPGEKAEPVVLRADRPFLFVVRDADYGNILYAGRVADPTK